MPAVFQILFFSLIIIILHELGHYVVLKLFKIPIYSIGISPKPLPHFYIRYKWPTSIVKHCLVILSGSITTILGSIILLLLDDYHTLRLIFVAYFFQFMCETNPFFSDFVFAYAICKNKIGDSSPRGLVIYHSLIKKHMFSLAWYIHFVLWSFLIISLIQMIDLHDVWNTL